ncbi:MAG: hypothetical protein ACYCSQ_00340 [bacterium]
MFGGKKVFTVEEKKRIAKEFISLPDRTEEDVKKIAGKYGIKYKTVYVWAKKYAGEPGFSYKKNSGGQGFKNRIAEQVGRKAKIVAGITAGKSREEIEAETGHIGWRSWYRYIREFKTGEELASSMGVHFLEVRRNRRNIVEDIKAGMPKKEVMKKYGIGRNCFIRRKKEAKKEMEWGSYLRFIGSDEGKAKIVMDLINGISKEDCLAKWKISEWLYDELYALAVMNKHTRRNPLTLVMGSRSIKYDSQKVKTKS